MLTVAKITTLKYYSQVDATHTKFWKEKTLAINLLPLFTVIAF